MLLYDHDKVTRARTLTYSLYAFEKYLILQIQEENKY